MIALYILLLFCRKYYFYNPYTGGFLSNPGTKGSYTNNFYTVTPQKYYELEAFKDQYLLLINDNIVLNHNKKTRKPIGWAKSTKYQNQLFTLENDRIKTEDFCLKGGLGEPFFDKCNGEEDEIWIKVDVKLGKKIKRKIEEFYEN